MTEASSPLSTRVPVHSLGISQILSYGLMFYAFAALKTPVAAATSLGESTVLTVLSMALILQAILMPIVGSWCDRPGALSVMRIGFLTGAAGIAGLCRGGSRSHNDLACRMFPAGRNRTGDVDLRGCLQRRRAAA